MDPLKRKLLRLYQDAHGIAHELLRQIQDVPGHRGREKADLHLWGQKLEDLVDDVHEAHGQHLISFVQDEGPQVISFHDLLLEEIVDTAGRANDKVLALAEALSVVPSGSAADASVATQAQSVPQCLRNTVDLLRQLPGRRKEQCLRPRAAATATWVEALERAHQEGRSLPRARLRLSDHIPAISHGPDGTLLDGARPLEAVSVDATEEILVKIHVVERFVCRVLDRAHDGHIRNSRCRHRAQRFCCCHTNANGWRFSFR
mmetsp:Transcript_84683/g.181475  ORF Transcript_84683/g.181475 Transcript_84683/m.181475 type:complete len:260 (+) Transcript_84683:729-1508(+)